MADMQTWGVRLFGSLFRRFITLKAGTNVTITETVSGREATRDEIGRALAFVGDPATGPARPAAWADLAHALFNTKEFIFLR